MIRRVRIGSKTKQTFRILHRNDQFRIVLNNYGQGILLAQTYVNQISAMSSPIAVKYGRWLGAVVMVVQYVFCLQTHEDGKKCAAK